MFFVLALANLGAFFLLGITCNVISQVVTHKYRREMFKNVLAQDMDFFDLPENSSGSLTSNLTAYPSSLQELISANILLILIVGVNLVSSSILAIAYGWKLGLVVVFGKFSAPRKIRPIGSGSVSMKDWQKPRRFCKDHAVSPTPSSGKSC